MNPANLPDISSDPYPLGPWGLAVFAILIVGAVIYVLWKLPRADDEGGDDRQAAP